MPESIHLFPLPRKPGGGIVVFVTRKACSNELAEALSVDGNDDDPVIMYYGRAQRTTLEKKAQETEGRFLCACLAAQPRSELNVKKLLSCYSDGKLLKSDTVITLRDKLLSEGLVRSKDSLWFLYTPLKNSSPITLIFSDIVHSDVATVALMAVCSAYTITL